MRVVGARVLSGPNLYDDSSGVVIGTELGTLPPAGQPFVSRPDRSNRILGALAITGLADEWTAATARGQVSLPDFLLRLATALVTSSSIFPSGGQIIDVSGSRLAVFLRCEHETIGITAWNCACKAVMACLDDGGVAAFEVALTAFRSAAQQYAADGATVEVAREARRLDLPWYRLKAPGQFIQIGQGTHRRHLLGGTSDATGAISRLISQDKQLTNRLLRAAGVPVLAMAEVMNEPAAVAAAERIGYPVVVKPCHGGQGRGVSVNLTSAAEVAAAFKLATATPDSVIVEKYAAGDDHRVLVVDGRIVSVARRVSGDGRMVDATDAIHPDNKAILERAAATLELAVAGIDFLGADITRSWREAGGAVLEMEAFPDLRPYSLAHPGRGVIEPILRSLLPPGSDGRIPTCAITGSLGKTTTANMVARIFGKMGLTVGRCTTVGVWIGEERVLRGDRAGGRYARDLLLDHRVQAGVFEIARGGLLNRGMTIDDVDVAAVLNIHDSHVGFDGIRGPEDLARIKSIVARRARRTLLLNADDPLCLAMRQVAGPTRLCLVGKEARSPALREHLAAGGDAVSLRPTPEGDEIVIVERGAVRSVMTTVDIPATLAGRHGGKVWNAMFAAGIAHAMGASLENIRDGLGSFRPDIGDTQGRLSIIHRNPCPVILDHAGRPIAGRELAAAIRKMPIAGRKLILITASRDAGPETIKDMGRALAGAFDVYVCTNRSELKLTDLHTTPGLLRDGIVEAGVAAADVHCILSEEEAVRYVLSNAGRDDLVVMISFKAEAHAALIESFDASRGTT